MTPETPTRHLVTVWNPSYADAMDETIQLLLARARQHSGGRAEEEDDFVWGGQIKPPNRQQSMPHLGDILSIDEELKGDDGASREVHLYITDYRSLYVAHVGEVTRDD